MCPSYICFHLVMCKCLGGTERRAIHCKFVRITPCLAYFHKYVKKEIPANLSRFEHSDKSVNIQRRPAHEVFIFYFFAMVSLSRGKAQSLILFFTSVGFSSKFRFTGFWTRFSKPMGRILLHICSSQYQSLSEDISHLQQTFPFFRKQCLASLDHIDN